MAPRYTPSWKFMMFLVLAYENCNQQGVGCTRNEQHFRNALCRRFQEALDRLRAGYQKRAYQDFKHEPTNDEVRGSANDGGCTSVANIASIQLLVQLSKWTKKERGLERSKRASFPSTRSTKLHEHVISDESRIRGKQSVQGTGPVKYPVPVYLLHQVPSLPTQMIRY
jgi:hypothetical protein